MIEVIAVVVTYNRKSLLLECLQALESQTYKLNRIIVINNCSTDGTTELLNDINSNTYEVLNLSENIGGAGGFSRGIQIACKYPCDYVLVLDDDCILNRDYVKKLLVTKENIERQQNLTPVSALCGTVYEHDKIATNHRGYMVRHKYFHSLDYWREYKEIDYKSQYLKCDIASFCGLMISRKAIDVIGYPKEDYFIKYDDTDYSLKLIKIGKIINANSSIINHKVKATNTKKSFDWKFYYDVRNSVDLAKRNNLYYYLIKVAIRSLITSSKNQSISLGFLALRDGLKGRLGKRIINFDTNK